MRYDPMEFQPECGRCHGALAPGESAYICALDCTFCPTCVRELKFVCPNCRGEVVRRPRPASDGKPETLIPPTSGGHVTVRRATQRDLDAVTPLFDGYRLFYQQSSNPAAVREFLAQRLSRDESIVLVAEDKDEAVGFTLLYPSFTSVSLAPIYVLNDLFVAADRRRRGVAALLLAAARQFGQESGAHYLELSTAVDNPAQRLYEASGWILDREFLHYELPLALSPRTR